MFAVVITAMEMNGESLSEVPSDAADKLFCLQC